MTHEHTGFEPEPSGASGRAMGRERDAETSTATDRHDPLSFFLFPPTLEVVGVLRIEALAPLSMVSSIPGFYYRSERRPTEHMIWGMLENIMGLHLAARQRASLLDPRQSPLRTRAKTHLETEIRGGRLDRMWLDHAWITGSDLQESGSAFTSFLQYHLRVETVFEPPTLTCEDYWNRLLREASVSFVDGARHVDVRVDDLVGLRKTPNPTRPIRKDGEVQRDAKTGRIKCEPMLEISDRADAKVRSPDEALEVIAKARDFYDRLPSTDPEYYLHGEGLAELSSHPFYQLADAGREKINLKALRPFFPRFYVSPQVREYVIPRGPYQVRVRTTQRLADQIATACLDPAAPAYLGTSEGWVDVSWQLLGAAGELR